jgi:hypothetical protein
VAVAHAICRAYDAIGEANRALKAAGLTPARVPANEFAAAARLAKLETVECLREPSRMLVTLIRNRSAVLAQEAAEEAVLLGEIDANPTWGLW